MTHPDDEDFRHCGSKNASSNIFAVRDMINWGIANGFKVFGAGALNYDPKLQMRHCLDPIDLYVRHRSTAVNAVLKRFLPLLDPTRRYPILRKFPNYDELWAA